MSISTQNVNAWAAGIAEVLNQEFPAAMAHISDSPIDCDVRPRSLHPSFWGCLDWHSSVHMQYSALRLLRKEMSSEVRDGLERIITARLSPEALEAERAYLESNPSYEFPYGRSWLLQLAKLANLPAMQPLVELTAEQFLSRLKSLNQPVRHGVHSNTAFHLYLIFDAAQSLGLKPVEEAIRQRAISLFGSDRDYPIDWELSGNDFLSNGLAESVLMSRVLPADEFTTWFNNFLPDLQSALNFLGQIPEVLDPTDGKLAHLYGLALTRAWMLKEMAPFLPSGVQERIQELVPQLTAIAEDQLVAGDFMSTHWLITYALLAEEGLN